MGSLFVRTAGGSPWTHADSIAASFHTHTTPNFNGIAVRASPSQAQEMQEREKGVYVKKDNMP